MQRPVRILHLEDEPDCTTVFERKMAMLGVSCEVVRVQLREEYLDQIRSHEFDAVVLDYTLPGLTGREALDLGRGICPEIPYLFFSGTVGEEKAVEVLRAGATDFIFKPRFDRLIPAVLRAIREVQDQRARREAEETLKKREEYFRTLIENVHDLISVVGMDGRVLYASPSNERVLGYHVEELVGSSAFELIHPDDGLRIRRILAEGFARPGATQLAEFRCRHKNGSWRLLEGRGGAFTNEDGVLVSVVVARDVTERKEAEEQLRDKAGLLDQARDAISVLDLENRILYWNSGAERLYGLSKIEVTGRHADAVLRPCAPGRHDQIRREVLEKGEWRGELQHTRAAGDFILLDSHWTLVRDSEGGARAFFVINTDITEKKKILTQFLHSQRMESVGTLASGIAHDLNNVLAPILMSVPLLRMSTTDAAALSALGMLEVSAQRGADIVRQVLTFARGLAGERVVLQPRHFIKEVARMGRETFPKTIQVWTDAPSDLWTVVGDATQLNQVLLNLCTNARDAMPNGGELSITAENTGLSELAARIDPDARPGNYVVIRVADTGTGISPEIRDRIFEPFFTTKELGRGTGLGLSTVLGITRSHGGFVTVDSEPGRGSTFSVYLPADVSARSKEVAAGESAVPQGRGETILVVDDEMAIRETLVTTLESSGYRALSAVDGPDGIAQFANHESSVSAVITDVAMPYMDGLAMVRSLRRLNPSIKVMTISGLPNLAERIASESVPVDCVLAKPFRASKLLTALRDMLDGVADHAVASGE